MIKTAEHADWCAYNTHNDCCGKSCDCGAVNVNNYIAELYKLLWEVASANRVHTLDETHVAVFIPVEIVKKIEDIVGYDEMGQ